MSAVGTGEWDDKKGKSKKEGKSKKRTNMAFFFPIPPKTLVDYRVEKSSESLDWDESIQAYRSRKVKSYWIGPYEIWDPEAEHCITPRPKVGGGGRVPISLPPKMENKMGAYCILIGVGQKGRPFAIIKSRVRRHKKTAVTFAEVFGSNAKGAMTLKGYVFEESEDLSLGMTKEQGQEQV